MPVAAGGGGLGVVGIIITLIIVLTGGNGAFGDITTGLGGMTPAAMTPMDLPDLTEDAQIEFLGDVNDSVQGFWLQTFAQSGREYVPSQITVFSSRESTGCGLADSSTGPFYCPADQGVYLDLSFFDELRTRLGAPGDFAQAYVIAHEFGHHVQNLFGTSRSAQAVQARNPDEANEISVLVELQADCYAGVWAFGAAQLGQLEPGDLEEGLTAAAAVGDDVLQQRAQGYVNPEGFTHGTAEQRQGWFTRGFESGDPDACETFESRGEL